MTTGGVIHGTGAQVLPAGGLPGDVALGSFCQRGGAWRLAAWDGLRFGIMFLLGWAFLEAVLPRGESPIRLEWAVMMPVFILLSASVTDSGEYVRGGGLANIADRSRRVRVAITPKQRARAEAVLSAPLVEWAWSVREPTLGLPVVTTPLGAWLWSGARLIAAGLVFAGLVLLLWRTPIDGLGLAGCVVAVVLWLLMLVPGRRRVTFRVEPGRLRLIRRGWFGRESASTLDLNAGEVAIDARRGRVWLRHEGGVRLVDITRGDIAGALAIARAALETPGGGASRS